ncbi:zinc-ribbon domain-containing protein [Paenarthrobacter nitroguajacolicus]|uniref:zinc-ribbon domain-containing protein n=1 Tax=Paenarthrobacter nitroguajacolicus TaxID=211146 RepID=UPI0015BE17B7|nr:zinc-ribbon domain-containing protein [Paenarthrobacter nitroguajacolicus]NWL09991.1 zinc-ribbon domain-containing protein [Paenarthrobacter nitroguajacolicus]
MFLLFGLKTAIRELPGRMATCQLCGQFAHHHLQQRATKFTLFFVPVFTTSKSYTISCTHCGRSSTISTRQKNALSS